MHARCVMLVALGRTSPQPEVNDRKAKVELQFAAQKRQKLYVHLGSRIFHLTLCDV
jgi:hypothetical protein